MLDFREKKKIRKTIYSKPVLFLLVIILLFVLKGTVGLALKYKEAD